MRYHCVPMAMPIEKKWRVEHQLGRGFIPWRPGYALPPHWTVSLARDDLPYLIELEFVHSEAEGPQCRSVRFAAQEQGEAISARRVRAVPIAECIQIAIGAVTVRYEETPEGLHVSFGSKGDDMTEQVRLARPTDGRTSDEHLREVAEVYKSAGKNPTRAVAYHWPYHSYSTAARWVGEARERGFLPPAKRRKSKGHEG